MGELERQRGDLETRFSALRKQVEGVPPDLPGFREVRARFYATEEGRGIVDAKVTLLAGRADSALRAGRREELQRLSSEIAETSGELRQIDQLHVALLHQVLALQRMAASEARR